MSKNVTKTVSKKKKPSKAMRYQLREANADVFREGFDMGYTIGYRQAVSDLNQEKGGGSDGKRENVDGKR